MDIFTLFLIPQMHIYSHGLQLRSPAGSCNRHNKNLFGSAIRQLLLLSKYPQIYPKPYPKRTCKSIFQSGIFLYHFGTSPFCCHNTSHIPHRKVTPDNTLDILLLHSPSDHGNYPTHNLFSNLVVQFVNYYCCQNIRKYTLSDTLKAPQPCSPAGYFSSVHHTGCTGSRPVLLRTSAPSVPDRFLSIFFIYSFSFL